MKPAYFTILLLLVTFILTNPVNLDGSVFNIDPHVSDANSQYVSPMDQGSMEPISRDLQSIIIIFLCIGFFGLAGIGRKRFGRNDHEKDITS
jgi:hypothetical protein